MRGRGKRGEGGRIEVSPQLASAGQGVRRGGYMIVDSGEREGPRPREVTAAGAGRGGG